MIIGNKIKQLREERGWSQEELAKRMGFANKQAVYRYEHSKSLKLDTLKKFADVFGVSPASFIDPVVPNEDYVDEYLDLIAVYNQLSDESKKKLMSYAEFLLMEGSVK